MAKANYTRLASKLSHSLQRYGAALISDHVGLEPAAQILLFRQRAYTPAYGQEHSVTWAVDHTSPHALPFTSVTHFYMGYYSFLSTLEG